MSMSGVEVDEEVTTLFNDMKLRSKNKYIIFRIEGKKMVVVDKESGEVKPKTDDRKEDEEHFKAMAAELTDEPRYLLYDFGFKTEEGRLVNKIAFIFWCPDKSKISPKMIYASTKDTVKKVFTGIGLEFQANDPADLDYTTLANEVEKKA